MEQLKHYKTPEEWGEMHSRIRARQKVCPECGTSFVAKHMERAVYCSKNCRQRGNRKVKRASYLKRKAEKRETQ